MWLVTLRQEIPLFQAGDISICQLLVTACAEALSAIWGTKATTGSNFPPRGCGAGNGCRDGCLLSPGRRRRGSAGAISTVYLTAWAHL